MACSTPAQVPITCETGEAVFLDRTVYHDSTRMMTGGKMAIDDKT